MNILFVVEPNFLNDHVGVRRVINYYYNEFKKLGREIYFTTYHNGEFNFVCAGEFPEKYKNSYSIRDFAPLTNEVLSISKIFGKSGVARQRDFLKKEKIAKNLSDFDDILITAPWLVDDKFPVLKNTSGIVYDVIPNLVSLNEIWFNGRYANLFKFTHQHKQGFEYFIRNSKKILHISENTKSDFALMKKYLKTTAVEHVVLPYEINSNISNEVRGTEPIKILCVNFFDVRKNFENGIQVLRKLKKEMDFELYLVGGPRMNARDIYNSLKLLDSDGIRYKWWLSGSDLTLRKLYQECDCLFFPSIYEGLGLPILEAQDYGKPCVTSNSSSCKEINYFGDLTCDYRDIDSFVANLKKIKSGNYRINSSVHKEYVSQLQARYEHVGQIF
ncbi:glycosyltransferase [Bdellovibrio sp. SKB1291214]|uniref:glycosyltransferase n=1 Tax=Bdellovibrio sp. SKB1291214 TaxID=1732569 RepID=UPI000B51A417|nr:glycosyltransferase [Bdellovibrio sp. SKB1291214]UYL08296.1 glycosyltransferase [Bdellovibrio sp. SKB1291214]